MKLINQLRIYECLQGITPIVLGVLLGGTLDHKAFYRIIYLIFISFNQQIFIYLYNDWTDVSFDLLNPRKNDVLKFENNKILLPLLFLSGLISLLGPLFLPIKSFLFLFLGFLAGVLHSFPSIRLKEKVFGPPLSHFIFGTSYTLAGYFLLKEFFSPEISIISASLYFGILFVSGGIFNDLMDFEFDKFLKPVSLISILGKRFVLNGIVLLQIISIFLSVFYFNAKLVIYFLIIYILVFFWIPPKTFEQRHLLHFRLFYRCYFLLITFCQFIYLLGSKTLAGSDIP